MSRPVYSRVQIKEIENRTLLQTSKQIRYILLIRNTFHFCHNIETIREMSLNKFYLKEI